MAGTSTFDMLIAMLLLGGVGKIIVGSSPKLAYKRAGIFHAACWGGILTGGLLALAQVGASDSGYDSLAGVLVGSTLFALMLVPGWYLAIALAVWLWEYPLGWPFRLAKKWRARQTASLWERNRTDKQGSRQRAEQEAKAREQRNRQQAAHDQQRRENARLECQLLYDRHAPQLHERFPVERLESYFEQYLSDRHPADEVESRAKLLRQLIEEHLQAAKPDQPAFGGLAEIADFYRRQRKELPGLGYDTDTAESMLAAIDMQEEIAVRRFMARGLSR